MIKHLEPAGKDRHEKRINFETLLAEISSRFVNVPADQVASEIESALRLVCESLKVDQSSIFLRDADDPDILVLTYILRDFSLLSPPTTKFTAAENFPWTNKKLFAHEIVYLPDIEQAPPEAAIDKSMWRKYGIYSTLAIPLSTGGHRPMGIWGIDSTTKKRKWSEHLQKRLKIIATVFANAIERAETERQLRESEARLRLAAETAGAGFWTWDVATGVIWTTPKLKEVFGLKPDDALNATEFFSIVLPEDRELVQKVVDSLATGKEATVEYRILPSGGQVRWLMSRGNLHKLGNEGPPILMGITVDITEQRATEEALRTVSGRLLRAQEQERKRIARELHDGINQRVALIVFGLEKLNAAKKLEPAEWHQIIGQLSRDAQAVSHEIQALSHKLHSSSLDYLGLEVAIEGLCQELRKLHGADIVFTHRDVPRPLPPELKLALFRITQEALHNALKYSGVNTFEVRLQGTPTDIEVTIRDAGVGFDVNKATHGLGLGLISMRERVVGLNGVVTVRSQPGSGTEIKASVPLSSPLSSDATSIDIPVAAKNA